MLIWIASALSFLYGSLCILAGLAQSKKKEIPMWTAYGFVFCGSLTVISSVIIFYAPIMLFLMIVCLISIVVIAIRNGYYMYGKINIKHQLVRMILSFLIVFFYMY